MGFRKVQLGKQEKHEFSRKFFTGCVKPERYYQTYMQLLVRTALVLDLVSASSVEVVSEGRQMQQCLNRVI